MAKQQDKQKLQRFTSQRQLSWLMHGEQGRQRRTQGRFKDRKRGPIIPMEKKIELFILRNSQNGYFTKFSTITTKFNMTESETWDIVGMLLSSGRFESVHDPVSGEMKMCETDKKYEIMEMGRRRKFEENAERRKENGGSRDGTADSQEHNRDRKSIRRGGNQRPNRRGSGRGAGSGRDRGHASRNGTEKSKDDKTNNQ